MTGWPETGVILSNEFASVRVAVDRRGHTPRLLIEDLETGRSTLLDPLELVSFCDARDSDRVAWLQVGTYREASS